MLSPEGEEVLFQSTNIKMAGDIESWLATLETTMKVTLTKMIRKGLKDYEAADTRASFVKEQKAQITAVVCNLLWTQYTEQSIDELESDPNSFYNWNQASNKQLEDLTIMIASGELNKVQHLSIIALITQDVHARDMIEDMLKADVSTTTDFLWSKQLRYYWDDTSGENGTCEVK